MTQPNNNAPTPDSERLSDEEIIARPAQKARRFAGKRSAKSIGFLGLVILIMLTLSAFYLTKLPILAAGGQYTAVFNESAGLEPGNEVRVAGVKVGEVQSVKLDGDKVKVGFRANDTWIGDQTQASIQIKTVLGQKYLGLTPKGSDLADPNKELTDTIAPYDVIEAFSDATNQIEDIDTDQVAEALTQLSSAFSQTPGDISASLQGITRLSKTISSRDQDVKKLLEATKQSSQILADRNEEFTRLIAGAGVLLEELNGRQEAISNLLVSTTSLSKALTGIVRDNEAQIGPALDSLKGVTTLLNNQNSDLRNAIQNMAPFYRLYANVLGNGRWFESTVTNLLPPALPAQGTDRLPNAQKEINNGGTTATAGGR